MKRLLIPTIILSALVLLVLNGIRIFSPRGKYRNLYLNIQVPNESESSAFQMVNEVLVAHAKLVDLRRLDHHSEMLQMTYNLQFRDQKELVELMDHLRERIPDSSFSFVDQKALPGV